MDPTLPWEGLGSNAAGAVRKTPVLLSVVVPSFQQAHTICAELERLHELLTTLVDSHEILLVIDGDVDGTKERVQRACALDCLRVECFAQNHGKGIALRHGLARARGARVAFLDAGGDLDPRFLKMFLAEMDLYDADIVIGSKRHSLAEVSYPWLRRLYSRAYQLVNRLLFRLRVRDTQVGMKLFRREVLAAVLPRLLIKRFAFDLELLVVANHLGFRRIMEAPVRLRYGFASSISWRAVARTLWDTLAIFYRLRVLRWYDVPRQLAPPPPAETVRVAAAPNAPAFFRGTVPAHAPPHASALPLPESARPRTQ